MAGSSSVVDVANTASISRLSRSCLIKVLYSKWLFVFGLLYAFLHGGLSGSISHEGRSITSVMASSVRGLNELIEESYEANVEEDAIESAVGEMKNLEDETLNAADFKDLEASDNERSFATLNTIDALAVKLMKTIGFFKYFFLTATTTTTAAPATSPRTTSTTTTTTTSTTTISTSSTTTSSTTTTTAARTVLNTADYARGTTVTSTDNWVTVPFGKTLSNPVVVAGPPDNNANPVSIEVQIKEVTDSSFSIRLMIPECHNMGAVSRVQFVDWVAVSSGNYLVGTTAKEMSAGIVTVSGLTVHEFNVSFSNGTPAVVSHQQTRDDDTEISHVRLDSSGPGSFTVILEQENNEGIATWTRDVGFIAVEQGDGIWDTSANLAFKAEHTAQLYRHVRQPFDYSSLGLIGPPTVLAILDTIDVQSVLLQKVFEDVLTEIDFIGLEDVNQLNPGSFCQNTNGNRAAQRADVLVIGAVPPTL